MSRNNRAVYVIASGGGSQAISDILIEGGASSFFVGAEIPYAQSQFNAAVGGEVWDGKYCSERAAHQLAAAAYDRAFEERQLNSIGVGVTASLAKKGGQRPNRINHVYIAVMSSWCYAYTYYYTFNSVTSRSVQERDCATLIKAIIDDALIRNDIYDPGVHFDVEPSIYWVTAPDIKDLHVSIDKLFVFPGSFNPMHRRHMEVIDYIKKKYEKWPVIEIALSHYYKSSISPFEYCFRRKQIQEMYPGIWVTFGNDPMMVDKHRSYKNQLHIKDDDHQVIMVMGADTFAKVSCSHRDEIDMLVFPRTGCEMVTHPRAIFADMEPCNLSSTHIRSLRRQNNGV